MSTRYAPDPVVESRNRQAKAKALARWCWRHGVDGADIAAAGKDRLDRWARSADVHPPRGGGDGDTWTATRMDLLSYAEWAGRNPSDPRTERPHLDEHHAWTTTPLPDLRRVARACRTRPEEPCPSPSPSPPPRRPAAPAAGTPATRAASARSSAPTTGTGSPAPSGSGTAPAVVPRSKWPKGWEHLENLEPVPDADCFKCGAPAVIGTLDGWRCAGHPPVGREWGARRPLPAASPAPWHGGIDWTPHPQRPPCGRTCLCGRCPHYQPAARSPLSTSALIDERAIASGKRRAAHNAWRAARDAQDDRRDRG